MAMPGSASAVVEIASKLREGLPTIAGVQLDVGEEAFVAAEEGALEDRLVDAHRGQPTAIGGLHRRAIRAATAPRRSGWLPACWIRSSGASALFGTHSVTLVQMGAFTMVEKVSTAHAAQTMSVLAEGNFSATYVFCLTYNF